MKHLIPVNCGMIDARDVKKLISIRDDRDRILGYTAILTDDTKMHLTPTEGRQVKKAKSIHIITPKK